MSTAPEEFEKLQKLLKLKRYEAPPPGYFNNFSTLVINRLEREARNDSLGSAWFKRLIGVLETNPVAAGLFGMSVCGLLVSGIAWSQTHSPADYSAASALTLDVADAGNSMQTEEVMTTASVDSLAPSTRAVFDNTNGASVFDSIQLPSAQPVSFQVGQ